MDSLGAVRCWAEIDLAAVRHNARLARERSGAELLAVVKANAYGHGMIEVARALRDEAAVFGVANAEEALELRESAGFFELRNRVMRLVRSGMTKEAA